MEAATAYFTRRARQERTIAADAGSTEARSAHLELALRLVRAATEPSLWSSWSEDRTGSAHLHNDHALEDVGVALDEAFPLPRACAFEQLLKAMDKKHS